jgi:PAS domain S-box-containing protein
MFSLQTAESPARIPITVAIVFATLLLAFALSGLATVQVLDEYAMLGRWLERPEPVSAKELAALRKDIGGRIVIRSVATAVLLLCTLSSLWLQQREFAIRQAFAQIRRLAHDILASMDQGVITTDQQSVVTSINPAAVNLLGLHSEGIGQPIARMSSAEVPLETMSRCVTEKKEPVSDRELTLDRDGRALRLVASALELKDSRGATIGCVIHLRDVTERMLMKEQMWRMRQFASLSTLASGLHHEIKNPITALSIHVQLLEERLRSTETSGAVGETIGVLKAEVQRLTVTLESFRNFASLQRLHPRPVDVRDLLGDVARLMTPQAAMQNVSLVLESAEKPLPTLDIDPEKIQQAVLNLVINALEAMPSGGALRVGAALTDGVVRLVVSDTGPGIPPEIQDHIFHPYFSTKDRGTGIGLALADKLIRQHHGHLDFRTGPTGTTFVITLPLNSPNRSEPWS